MHVHAGAMQGATTRPQRCEHTSGLPNAARHLATVATTLWCSPFTPITPVRPVMWARSSRASSTRSSASVSSPPSRSCSASLQQGTIHAGSHTPRHAGAGVGAPPKPPTQRAAPAT